MDTPAETISQLPLFPLNAVLFPDGSLPLQIFEPRYLDMIARQHAAGQPFGVVCLSEGREVRMPAAEGFASERVHAVGTLARIDELEQPQPALLLIACTGLQRFRVLNSAQGRFGLWMADVEILPADIAVELPDDLAHLRDKLQHLLAEAERENAAHGAHVAFSLRVPPRWNDSGWIANRWCELLPLGPAEKQRLLALDSPVLRAELVSDTLAQMGFGKASG